MDSNKRELVRRFPSSFSLSPFSSGPFESGSKRTQGTTKSTLPIPLPSPFLCRLFFKSANKVKKGEAALTRSPSKLSLSQRNGDGFLFFFPLFGRGRSFPFITVVAVRLLLARFISFSFFRALSVFSSSMPPTATLEIDSGVAVITLQNPPVNALHPDGEENMPLSGARTREKKRTIRVGPCSLHWFGGRPRRMDLFLLRFLALLSCSCSDLYEDAVETTCRMP